MGTPKPLSHTPLLSAPDPPPQNRHTHYTHLSSYLHTRTHTHSRAHVRTPRRVVDDIFNLGLELRVMAVILFVITREKVLARDMYSISIGTKERKSIYSDVTHDASARRTHRPGTAPKKIKIHIHSSLCLTFFGLGFCSKNEKF